MTTQQMDQNDHVTVKLHNLKVTAYYKDGREPYEMSKGGFSFSGFNAFKKKCVAEKEIDYLHIVANNGLVDVKWKIYRLYEARCDRGYQPIHDAVKQLFWGEIFALKVSDPTY